MQAGCTGKWASIFFPFLHIAFSVGGPSDQHVVTCSIWHPFGFPKRPCQIAAGIIDLSVAPRFAAVAAQFHALDTTVTTVGDSLHFNRPAQFAQRERRPGSGTSILDLVGVIKSGPQPCAS